jgi:hypothetical protein
MVQPETLDHFKISEEEFNEIVKVKNLWKRIYHYENLRGYCHPKKKINCEICNKVMLDSSLSNHRKICRSA